MPGTKKDPRLGIALTGVVVLLGLVSLWFAPGPDGWAGGSPAGATPTTAPEGSPLVTPESTDPLGAPSPSLPLVFPDVSEVATPAPTTGRTPSPLPTGPRPTSTRATPPRMRTGTATWYCCTRGHPRGLYAAAGSEIRVGKWRGRYVQVCGGGHCVRVQLIDWCACKGSRIIDLYPDAFRRLAPLSQGVTKVTVRW